MKHLITFLATIIICTSFSNNILRIKVSNSTTSSEAILRLHPEATEMYDINYDAPFFNMNSPLCIYSESFDNRKLTINSINEYEYNEVNVIVENTMMNDSISINITGVNSFDPDTELFFEDLETGEYTNLRTQDQFVQEMSISQKNYRVVMYRFATITSLEASTTIYETKSTMSTPLEMDEYMITLNFENDNNRQITIATANGELIESLATESLQLAIDRDYLREGLHIITVVNTINSDINTYKVYN